MKSSLIHSRTYLELSDYDLEFCRRLALSPKSRMQVKRTARVLLEMHRYQDAACLSMRTGIPVTVLGQIRRRYETDGLQQVLAAGIPVEVPTHSRRLVLDEGERHFCRKVVDEQLGSAGRQRRARALLLLDQAFEKAEAARTSGLCERTLERLVERYQTHGAEGAVNDGPRLGRPVRYPREEFVPLIQQIVQQTRPETLLKWTMKDLRHSLASYRSEAGEISEPTLRTLMREAGLNFRQLGYQ